MTDKHRIIEIRTGYVLEYVPRGKRTPTREMVTETVPVTVREAAAEPAVIEGGATTLYVSGDLLYRDTGLAADQFGFEAIREARAHHDLGHLPFAHRPELVVAGIKGTAYAGAPDRRTLEVRELIEDQAEDGRAHAQRMADDLLVSDGRILYRAGGCPSLRAAVSPQGARLTPTPFPSPAFDNVGQDTTFARMFRTDAVHEAAEFVSRASRGKDLPVDRTSLDAAVALPEWTDAGRAAECVDAWWLILSAENLARYPLRGDDVAATDLPRDALVALSDIRGLFAPFRRHVVRMENRQREWMLPAPAEAASVGNAMLDRLETVVAAVGRDRRPAVATLATRARLLAEEGRGYCPTLSGGPRQDDDVALAAFTP